MIHKCDLCKFESNKLYNYKRHLTSKKHINNQHKQQEFQQLIKETISSRKRKHEPSYSFGSSIMSTNRSTNRSSNNYKYRNISSGGSFRTNSQLFEDYVENLEYSIVRLGNEDISPYNLKKEIEIQLSEFYVYEEEIVNIFKEYYRYHRFSFKYNITIELNMYDSVNHQNRPLVLYDSKAPIINNISEIEDFVSNSIQFILDYL